MNISKKQISLGTLAVVTVVAVPITTTISCGKKDAKDNNKTNGENNGGNVNQNSKNVIDLTQMKTVEEFVETINSKLNLAMPKRADILAKMENNIGKLEEKSFNEIKKYMDRMNPDNFQELIVKIGNEEIKWDLKNLLKNIEIVRDSLEKGYKSIKDAPAIYLENPVPSAGGMVAFIGSGSRGSAGSTFGLFLTGFSELEGNGYAGYNGILDAYHDFAKQVISSTGFKTWMNDKEYKIISYDYTMDGNFSIIDTNNYKIGEGLDKEETRKSLNPMVNSPSFKSEGNNFEAQWITTILKMSK